MARRSEQGLTLVELVIVVTCSAFLLAVLSQMYLVSVRVNKHVGEASSNAYANASFTDRFERDVRTARNIRTLQVEGADKRSQVDIMTSSGKCVRWLAVEKPDRSVTLTVSRPVTGSVIDSGVSNHTTGINPALVDGSAHVFTAYSVNKGVTYSLKSGEGMGRIAIVGTATMAVQGTGANPCWVP